MKKKRKPQIWIQMEGGLIWAIKFPRGMEVHVMDLNVDGWNEEEPGFHKSCRLCRDPHYHREQTEPDAWSINKEAK